MDLYQYQTDENDIITSYYQNHYISLFIITLCRLKLHHWFYTFMIKRIHLAKDKLKLIQICLDYSSSKCHPEIISFFSVLKSKLLSQCISLEDKNNLHPFVLLYSLFLNFIYYTQKTDFQNAHTNLMHLQTLIEDPKFIFNHKQEFDDGLFSLKSGEQMTVVVWMTKLELVSMIYFMSGVLHLNKDPNKSKKFLAEGLKSVESRTVTSFEPS